MYINKIYKKCLLIFIFLVYIFCTPIFAEDDNDIYTGRISVGGAESGAIDSNGNLYVWGVYKSPKEVLLSNMRYINFSNEFYGGIDQDNNLWMWGKDNDGRLSTIDTDVNSQGFRDPAIILDDVYKVSLGGDFTSALKTDGTLWIWGMNEDHQLGYEGEIQEGAGAFNSDKNYSNNPYKLMSNVKDVACGEEHTIVIKNDGSLWGWGNNESHQISWSTISTETPVPINEDKNFVKCFAGDDFSAAITDNNELYIWGSNQDLFRSFTETGPNLFLFDSDPYLTDVQDFAFGSQAWYILKTDGTLLALGTDQYSQLGLPDDEAFQHKDDVFGLVYVEEPTKVLDQCTNLYVGGIESDHVLVRREDGTVWGWGKNDYGQVKADADTDVPIQVNDLEIGPLKSVNNIFSLNPIFYVTMFLGIVSLIFAVINLKKVIVGR